MRSDYQGSTHNGSLESGPLSIGDAPAPRRRAFLIVWCIFAIIAVIGFIALGNWQVERRTWKLALIERVESRIHAPAIPTPAQSAWAQITPATHEYLHVSASGQFMHEAATFVQASTVLGSGFWAIVPLRQADNTLILVNRGFVAKKDDYRADPTSTSNVSLTGLLRISEAGGSRMRDNEPQNERWFSRDVSAIAAARGLSAVSVSPYFIDVDASDSPVAGEPVGGLTVVSFYNHHLVYALTWYTLALMVAGATAYLLREEYKKSRS